MLIKHPHFAASVRASRSGDAVHISLIYNDGRMHECVGLCCVCWLHGCEECEVPLVVARDAIACYRFVLVTLTAGGPNDAPR